jgi:antitoxin MazE
VNSRVVRGGDGFIVSLPREALDALGLDEGAELAVQVNTSRGEIVLTPIGHTPMVDDELAQQLASFIDRYRPALDALAR